MKTSYTRIRYTKKRESDELVSVQKFRGNQGGLYEVVLDTEVMSYKIRNVKQRTIVRSTEKDGKKTPKHLNTLKKQAKAALKTMGVQFKIDIRGIDV